MSRTVTAQEAVAVIRSGDRVFIHSVAAAPQQLIAAMTARADELRVVEVVSLHTEGPAPYAAPELARSFRVNALFVGANVRQAVNEGRADYLPVFLSEVPQLFRTGVLPIDVALIQVSPPDRHGCCSLGVSVDVTRAAVQVARTVIAQVNPNMPRTHGDGIIHVDNIDFLVPVDDPIPEPATHPHTEAEQAIGLHCAELVEDGACLQLGIGAIPDATLVGLRDHRRLYDFLDDNPQVSMLDIAYINDTAVIRRNPKVIAINSALEVDLTGQVCADSIGDRLFSGVGGQMDFIRGAALSEGGKPIIALPSVTSKGDSRIVSYLQPGAGVVSTRAHVHYVVTEHGIADLWGKNLRQRAAALIAIAHPSHRDTLTAEARRRFGTW
jgi:4-hydroxybutyrate CoA-transferase